MNTLNTPTGILCVLVGFVLVGAVAIGPAMSQTWQPPEPSTKELDWIKLTSGEWLKGEIKSLRDDEFEFDSDELDLLKLDWGDVAELRSPRILTYRFEDIGTFTGTAEMRDGVVSIRVGDEVRDFPRAQLLLVLEGGQKEWDYWSAKGTVGFVGRSGNTNQNDVNSTIRVRRQTPKTRLDANYNGNVGEVEGTQTINNHNFTVSIDALLTAGLFVTPAAVNIFTDEFTNIDYRLTVAAGLGYDIYRGGDFEWSVGLAGGYLTTKNVSVEAGEDDSESSFTVIPNTKIAWDITGDIEFVFDYNAQVSVPETSNAFHHAFGEISFDIWGDILDLNFNLTWDRNESPAADADGNVPKRDDFRTAFGIGVSF